MPPAPAIVVCYGYSSAWLQHRLRGAVHACRAGEPLLREHRAVPREQSRLLCGQPVGGAVCAEVLRPGLRPLPLCVDASAAAPAAEP